jgi:Flp pilus assembly protein TadB
MYMRKCQYPDCDNKLITGRKYCWKHRGAGKYLNNTDKSSRPSILFFITTLLVIYILVMSLFDSRYLWSLLVIAIAVLIRYYFKNKQKSP